MKFEAYEATPGTYRWRIRDENGEIVKINPGRVMGVDGTVSERKLSEQVVNEALKRLAGAGAKSARKSLPRRRPKRAAEA